MINILDNNSIQVRYQCKTIITNLTNKYDYRIHLECQVVVEHPIVGKHQLRLVFSIHRAVTSKLQIKQCQLISVRAAVLAVADR